MKTATMTKLMAFRKSAMLILNCAIAAVFFISCASAQGSGDPMTLTITGIPVEFEGKSIEVTLRGSGLGFGDTIKGLYINPYPDHYTSRMTVTNGQLMFSLYTDGSFNKIVGYTGRRINSFHLTINEYKGSMQVRQVLAAFDKNLNLDTGPAVARWSDAVIKYDGGVPTPRTAEAPGPTADMVPVQAQVPDTPDPPVTEDDFEIKQNAQGGITITRYTGKAKNVTIPATISGLPVTEIGNGAFQGLELTAITIPNGVTAIGDRAFGSEFLPSGIRKNNFQDLVVPDSVIRIGKSAFENCSIRTINLGNGLQYIGGNAFNGNAIDELTISDSVIEIGDSTTVGSGTFAGCGIKTLNLGKSIVKIGANAFNSNNLTEITLPASLRTIGRGAFSNNQLTALVIPNGVIYIESGQFVNLTPFAGNPIASLTIPPSLISSYYNVTDWDESNYRGFAGSFSGLPITRITLPANVHEANLRQFGESFVNFWKIQGKKAGAYVYTGRIWTVQ
jgi:hypothetical protein